MTKTGFCFFAFLLCLSLCSCRQKSSQTTADTRIEWKKKNWDFGNITAGEEVSHTSVSYTHLRAHETSV